MINVGVVGLGNLGKAVVKQLQNSNEFHLIAVFSRRKIKGCTPYEEILDYKDKIDLLFLCGGSKNDLEIQATFLAKNFNIIDSYDNHSRLKNHVQNIDCIAQTNNKVALCSLGWDPGLFSLIRGLFSLLGYAPYTFWGKGVSQGHTQAIKQISGVKDAIQFTIPNENAISKIKNGKRVKTDQLHSRECFIVCDKKDEKRIKKQVINMPNYFKGYHTTVNFVEKNKLAKLKSFSHKGEIITQNNILDFSLNIQSNPDFTAKILISFAKSLIFFIKNKNYGAKTIFDIPLKCILNQDLFSIL